MKTLLCASLILLALDPLASGEDLYVSGSLSGNVLRYDADSGAFDQEFVGGLASVGAKVYGPDGHLYVASPGTHEVLRFDGQTGAPLGPFVSAGSGGLDRPVDIEFSHDGALWVLSEGTSQILQYSGTTGAFLRAFVSDDPQTPTADETGGLLVPGRMALGVDGHLYVSDTQRSCIHKYDGELGFHLGLFVDSGSGGLSAPTHLVFGPIGGLYVVSSGTGQVLQFDELTGAFERVFVDATSGGLDDPTALQFAPDRHLYLASAGTDEVLRYDGQTGAFVGIVVGAGDGGLDRPDSLLFDPMRRIRMRGPDPAIGASTDFFIYEATPGELMGLFVGFLPGQFPVPLCGYSLELNPYVLLQVVASDPQGTLSLPISYPPFASGFPLLWQVLEPASCRASRVLRSTVGDSGSAVTFVLDPQGNICQSSTFVSGSFRLVNRSTGGQKIERVRLDLSTAFFRDMVYDPFGVAGDTVGKDFSLDFENGDGSGFINRLLNKPEDSGFSELELNFNDFESGETVAFSIDVDPSTIQGSGPPGPNDSGSISGLELCGSTLEITFDDGSIKTGTLYRLATSVTGSTYEMEADLPPAPRIEVHGVAPPVATNQANHTVRVHGRIGHEVKLLQVEGGQYLAGVPGGGFDVEPFESNKALNVQEFSAIVGTDGFVDIPVTLRQSGGLETGYNHFLSAQFNAAGRHGSVSNSLLLKFEP